MESRLCRQSVAASLGLLFAPVGGYLTIARLKATARLPIDGIDQSGHASILQSLTFCKMQMSHLIFGRDICDPYLRSSSRQLRLVNMVGIMGRPPQLLRRVVSVGLESRHYVAGAEAPK